MTSCSSLCVFCCHIKHETIKKELLFHYKKSICLSTSQFVHNVLFGWNIFLNIAFRMAFFKMCNICWTRMGVR